MEIYATLVGMIFKLLIQFYPDLMVLQIMTIFGHDGADFRDLLALEFD
jgi:hypothetical protein